MTTHTYTPYGTCIDLFSSREPQVLFAGPAGTGKSRACLEKLHLMAMLNPGMRALMVRKTLTSLTSTGLVTFREHVAGEHIASGEVTWYGGSPQEAACYKYKNGSVIVVGGMDKAMKIMSSEYDVVYVQEATELVEDDWEKITTRLRNGKVSFQQIIADANPDMPTHWLKVRADKGQTKLIESRHEDNPTLFNRDGTMTTRGIAYMGALDALTGVRYNRLRKGLWCAAEGLIYDTFDPGIHIYPAMRQPPRQWTRYWSIDFGYTNPFVCQMWAEDPDGRLYLYRELYMTQQTVADMAERIKAALKNEKGADEPMPSLIVADHDAEGREQLQRLLGIHTTAAHKAVSEGIDAVKERLKVAGDGKPRIYFCRDALVERDPLLEAAKKPCSTLEEIVGYVWDRGTEKAQADGKPPKEVPLKQNDHGMDAKRYLVAQKDLKGEFRMRVLKTRQGGWQ